MIFKEEEKMWYQKVPGHIYQVMEDVTRYNYDGSLEIETVMKTYWEPPNGEEFPLLSSAEKKAMQDLNVITLLKE